ncbi:hypothetical protein UFOVP1537_42 [uncultured Caudovirales phage]|uniref:Uncharacterized protein n=2 Tax=root TaxID=1 RepID=A0A6J5QE41_9CAUD|nr:hypothetical protein UFOVP825_7 [uncultured Caudovirales phage]CAB4171311.1 hypothetical protein UFOVP915_42 [uncultured Caudovirales phage]CAB4177189.1 hypothetical protein UFOVP1000_6 [uncultured Caudovirales phage]CAB4183060.1 hypothetical protein UFOVP1092_34 [uncultured Caudovirales phage]CAB4187626.1 hypothetical protein UFOVP1152_38 [uncultured Caudovirales phage]
MPTPTTIRPWRPIYRNPAAPGQLVQPKEFFNPPSGLNTTAPISRVDPSEATSLHNLRMDGGWLTQRPGITPYGSTSSDAIVHALVFTSADGTEWLCRWTTTKVQYWSGTVWSNFTGSGFTVTEDAIISTAVWGDKLMFTDNTSGLWQIDFVASTYTHLTNAPICRQVSMFDRRAVLSYVSETVGGLQATRIRWSVKDDNNDYSGLGSGYEDLVSSSASIVDSQIGVYPINDIDALVVRGGSIWKMSITGYYDAPFSFLLLFPNIRTDAPQGTIAIPGGIAVLGRDDVFLVMGGGPQSVGAKIRTTLFDPSNDLANAVMQWDDLYKRLILYVPKLVKDGYSNVYHYYVNDGKWTQDIYHFNIKYLSLISYASGTAIGDLVGMISDLTGTIIGLTSAAINRGLLYTTLGANGIVCKEDINSTTDLDGTGAQAVMPILAQTGMIFPATIFEKVSIIELRFEYEAAKDTTLLIEYSADGGNTWTTYSTVALLATTKPTVAKVTTSLERDSIMFRCSSTDTLGFSLNSFVPWIQLGAEVLI